MSRCVSRTSRPRHGGRRYIVAVFGNLGYRFSDPSQAAEPDYPCFTTGVCYTGRLAWLGGAVDEIMRRDGS